MTHNPGIQATLAAFPGRRAPLPPVVTPLPAAARRAGIAPAQVPLPPGTVLVPPLDRADQGISPSEQVDGDNVIAGLLKAPGVAFAATWRNGLYEIHGPDGAIFYRRIRLASGRLAYQVVAIQGTNPIPGMDPFALQTFAEEVANAGGITAPPHEKMSYPDLLGRIAAVFDHRNSPDITYVQRPGADPNHQPSGGSHGAAGITQSRAPLVVAGPGVAQNAVTDVYARITDVAPTIAQFLGIQPVLGTGTSGVVKPQLLRWQDGESLAPAIADARYGAVPYGTAQRAIVFVVDGLSQTALENAVRRGEVPNIASVMAAGTTFRNGHIVGIPSVTWAGHNSLLTGATPGAHGMVNNAWYDRERQTLREITDGGLRNSFGNGKDMSPRVETLYEAVSRSFGPGAVTASLNNPATRGASLATLELGGLLHALRHPFTVLEEFLQGTFAIKDPELDGDPGAGQSGLLDNIAIALGAGVLSGANPARLAVFEFALTDSRAHKHGPHAERAHAALRETDQRIGRILSRLRRDGLLGNSLIVVTSDHGMETQGDPRSGGWFKAVDATGVKTINHTRFVYIRNMVVTGLPSAVRSGVATAIGLQVLDEDRNKDGGRPAAAGAIVEILNAQGKVVATATAGPDGRASLPLPALARGSYTVRIQHEDLTTWTGTLRAR